MKIHTKPYIQAANLCMFPFKCSHDEPRVLQPNLYQHCYQVVQKGADRRAVKLKGYHLCSHRATYDSQLARVWVSLGRPLHRLSNASYQTSALPPQGQINMQDRLWEKASCMEPERAFTTEWLVTTSQAPIMQLDIHRLFDQCYLPTLIPDPVNVYLQSINI